MRYRLDSVRYRPGSVSSRLGEVSSRLSEVSSRLGEVSSRLGEVSARLGKVSARLGEVSTRLLEVSLRLREVSPPHVSLRNGRLSIDESTAIAEVGAHVFTDDSARPSSPVVLRRYCVLSASPCPQRRWVLSLEVLRSTDIDTPLVVSLYRLQA